MFNKSSQSGLLKASQNQEFNGKGIQMKRYFTVLASKLAVLGFVFVLTGCGTQDFTGLVQSGRIIGVELSSEASTSESDNSNVDTALVASLTQEIENAIVAINNAGGMSSEQHPNTANQHRLVRAATMLVNHLDEVGELDAIESNVSEIFNQASSAEFLTTRQLQNSLEELGFSEAEITQFLNAYRANQQAALEFIEAHGVKEALFAALNSMQGSGGLLQSELSGPMPEVVCKIAAGAISGGLGVYWIGTTYYGWPSSAHSTWLAGALGITTIALGVLPC